MLANLPTLQAVPAPVCVQPETPGVVLRAARACILSTWFVGSCEFHIDLQRFAPSTLLSWSLDGIFLLFLKVFQIFFLKFLILLSKRSRMNGKYIWDYYPFKFILDNYFLFKQNTVYIGQIERNSYRSALIPLGAIYWSQEEDGDLMAGVTRTIALIWRKGWEGR